MAIRFNRENIADDVFIADNATVLGEVAIGERSSVWFGAVIRGDTDVIRIGTETNVQDLSCIHVDSGFPCSIGNRVTIGHAAIVHGATIEDDVLIGMRAVVMNGAVIGKGSLVAAGAIVTEGTQVPENSLVLGVPGKVVRPTTEDDRHKIAQAAQHYSEIRSKYT